EEGEEKPDRILPARREPRRNYSQEQDANKVADVPLPAIAQLNNKAIEEDNRLYAAALAEVDLQNAQEVTPQPREVEMVYVDANPEVAEVEVAKPQPPAPEPAVKKRKSVNVNRREYQEVLDRHIPYINDEPVALATVNAYEGGEYFKFGGREEKPLAIYNTPEDLIIPVYARIEPPVRRRVIEYVRLDPEPEPQPAPVTEKEPELEMPEAVYYAPEVIIPAPIEETVEEPVEEVEEQIEEVVEEPVEEILEQPEEEVVYEELPEIIEEEQIEEIEEEQFEPEPEPEPEIEIEEQFEEEEYAQLSNGIRYDRSFTAKIIQSDDDTQRRYGSLRNRLLAYKGVKSRISWSGDTFRMGRRTLAKLAINGKTLLLYLALEPSSCEGTKYRVDDVSAYAKHVDTPCRYKVNGERKLLYARQLIDILLEGVKLGVESDVYILQPYQSDKALIESGLIKVVTVRGKKGPPKS
ncbi:MAG: hypothetical protein K2I79_01425, partial [Clostridia bacterium]|nr:hypothetical protein [Clostridia bacterium]